MYKFTPVIDKLKSVLTSGTGTTSNNNVLPQWRQERGRSRVNRTMRKMLVIALTCGLKPYFTPSMRARAATPIQQAETYWYWYDMVGENEWYQIRQLRDQLNQQPKVVRMMQNEITAKFTQDLEMIDLARSIVEVGWFLYMYNISRRILDFDERQVVQRARTFLDANALASDPNFLASIKKRVDMLRSADPSQLSVYEKEFVEKMLPKQNSDAPSKLAPAGNPPDASQTYSFFGM
jgi:hypothetical protein